MDYRIESWEREYLRDYAKKQLEIANLPVMAERTKRWYAHNENKKGTPMIVVELGTFKNEIVTDPKTVSPFAQEIEREIRNNILVHEMFDDDEVCPDFITMSWDITYQEYGFNIPVKHATDNMGRDIGFVYDHPVHSIAEDFHKLKPFTFTVDRDNTIRRLNAANEIMGDILKVELMNGAHRWCNMVTLKAIQLMGMEEWMIEMIDAPEDAHMLMEYITTNLLAYFHWMENENVLTMNNGNHYAGAGSRGFTHELKMPADGHVRLKDMWVNVNSQESSAISPSMYKEFVFPYIERIAKEFGMVYYGCCEAIDPLWDKCLKDLSNLRKVSISPWCNEEFMGERLRGTNIIYSRKPDPKFLGVGYDFDDNEYKAYMNKTLNAARGCNLEIIFRDVYTLSGNPSKVKRAVKLLREVIEKNWQ